MIRRTPVNIAISQPVSRRITLNVSLRIRIALFSTAIMALLLVVLIRVAAGLFSSGLREGTDLLLNQDSATIQNLLTLHGDGSISLFAFEPADSDEALRRLLFQVQSMDGDILLASGNLNDSPIRMDKPGGLSRVGSNLQDVLISNEWIRINTAFYTVSNGLQSKPVVIHTVRSIDPFYRHEKRLQHLLYWLLPIPIILTFLGSWWISSRTLRPVDEMINTVRKMDIEDLTDRLPVYQNDEIGRLAGTFNSLLEKLDGSFKSLRRFTADASHELRGPLSVIKTQGEVALSRERNNAEYRQIIGGMLEELENLEALTQSLLDLARWDAGIAKPKLETIDISVMVSNWLERLSILFSEKSLHLSSEIQDNIVIEGDVAAIERIVTNIFDNAIKYTPSDGEIHVSLSGSDGAIELVVADTGIGIPEEDRERVFERFVRLDAARTRKEGSGLGLSLVKWAVEIHGGSIQIEDNTPNGSRFVVVLAKKPPERSFNI